MTSANEQQDDFTIPDRKEAANANGNILETFYHEESLFPFIPANMIAPVNSLHLNVPYTIRSTSGETINNNIEGQSSDMFDINELFQGEFFPGEIDFTKYLNFSTDAVTTPIFNEHSGYINSSDQNTTTSTETLAATIGATNNNGFLLIPPPLSRLPLPMLMSAKTSNKLSIIDSNASTGGNETSSNTFSIGSKRSMDQRPLSSESSNKVIKIEPLSKSNEINRSATSKYLSDREIMEYQRIERRERNREHAKRSRIRKKLLLDSLQEQLLVLRRQNKLLRRVVVQRLRPEIATALLSDCTIPESDLLVSMRDEDSDIGKSNILNHTNKDNDMHTVTALALSSENNSMMNSIISSNTHNASNNNLHTSISTKHVTPKILMEADYRLIQSLVISQQNFVLSDPSLPDNPIVYASDGFCRMTGYKNQDVIGRNCRFLQGPGTDATAVELIRQGIVSGQDISVCLLNYKADGSPFWNQFFLAALKDATGSIVNFVGVQCEVNTIPVKELKDRVKKLPLPFAEMSAGL